MKFTIEIDSLEPYLLDFYQDGEPNKIKDALYHGYQIVNSPEYALNLHQNEAKTSTTIQTLKDKVAEMTQKNEELEKNYQQNLHRQLTEQHQTFSHKEKMLQAQVNEVYQKQIQEKLDLEKQIKAENLEQVKKLEAKNETLEEKIFQNFKENQEKIDLVNQNHKIELMEMQEKLDRHYSIQSNSSRKGQIGEMRTGDLLNKLFPAAEIYETGHTTANGDFRIVIQGVQILYEHKNFQNNVPKRDIDKFLRDIEVSDCDGGIMCSENSGIACRNDLDLEIVGENEKPGIYLHHTGINPEKIQIAVHILVNILINKVDLNTSTLAEIKEQVKETDSIMSIYQSNKKNIGNLQAANERLAVHNRKIKYRLEHVIELLASNTSGQATTMEAAMEGGAAGAGGAGGTSHRGAGGAVGTAANKKIKQKCEYCGKAYVNLENHYLKCEKKKLLDGI